VGNQLTIESASGDQGAIIGNVGPAPSKGGKIGNDIRRGGGGGNYGHLKVGGQHIGQQRQQQDLPLAPKCGISRGCKPRGGQNTLGGVGGRQNALASGENRMVELYNFLMFFFSVKLANGKANENKKVGWFQGLKRINWQYLRGKSNYQKTLKMPKRL
jgi:hypothetical protein